MYYYKQGLFISPLSTSHHNKRRKKSNAYANFKFSSYSQEVKDRSEAVKLICKQSAMLKFKFIYKYYLRVGSRQCEGWQSSGHVADALSQLYQHMLPALPCHQQQALENSWLLGSHLGPDT